MAVHVERHTMSMAQSTSRQRRSATAGESRDGGIPATLGRQWPHPITDRLTDRRGLPQGVLRQEATALSQRRRA